MTPERIFEFVWLSTFERTAKGLLDDTDRREIENELLEDPEKGPVMPRTGGFRKLRHGLPGRGKSGGARIIYLYDGPCERFFMLLAYSKSRKDTLTRDEEKELKAIAKALKDEEC